jgi:hypothetical protein
MGNPAEGGDPTKRWNPTVAAFTTFFESVELPSLFASLALFPAVCNRAESDDCPCLSRQYDPSQADWNPTVPLTGIAANASTFTALFNQPLVSPYGDTPTIAALQGALSYASSVQSNAMAGAVTSVILVTDGEPGFELPRPDGGNLEGCTGNDIPTIAELVQSYHDQGIDTWVFALGALPGLGPIAAAGGHPLVTIDLGDPAATEQQLLSSLQSLPALNCAVPLPPAGGSLDPSLISLLYTNAANPTPQTLAPNPGCQSGDASGWDMATSRLCANTCNQLGADPTLQLFLDAGCISTHPPM